jgi:hypothetical protein
MRYVPFMAGRSSGLVSRLAASAPKEVRLDQPTYELHLAQDSGRAGLRPALTLSVQPPEIATLRCAR